MSKNNKPLWQIDRILKLYNDGSFKTRSDREQSLRQFIREVTKVGGFKIQDIHNLKPKHIHYFIESCKEKDLSEATIKNKVAHIRWLAAIIGKPDLIPKSNAELGIGQRVYLTNQQKAVTLTPATLELIGDKYIAMSLMLQAGFGLRREEAIKIRPSEADRGDKLVLQGSWCKNGRGRVIPIETAAQRVLLEAAKRLANGGSLIPPDRNYKEQMKLYENLTANAGIKGHGLRHSYAQGKYKEITGFNCKVDGGKDKKEMTIEEKKLDRQAREIISQRLGHNRIEITNNYLGR